MFKLKNQKLLVIAPHPDDEVLGCGGLIAKIKKSGGTVHVLFLTVGDTKDFTKVGLSSGKERLKEIKEVAKFLKYDDYDLAFPGNDYHLKLDLVGQKVLMDLIERDSPVSIEKIKPTIVAFPNQYSYNQDHQIAAKATHAALRPAPTKNRHFVQMVLSYESPADSWTLKNNFEPNFFVPLTVDEIKLKISALKLYSSQMRKKPNPRSPEVLKALVTLRGSQCASDLAEAYTLSRAVL